MPKIDPKPAAPPATDFNSARYWDERDLESELRRVFEVCHSCRMCVNFCGSFPDLFGRVAPDTETREAHGAELLDVTDFTSVTDLCWQCKMCYIECPYTPDQGHAWMIDVPRLLQREKANRAKRNGITMQDRALGEPGRLGSLSSGVFAPVSNFVNANRLMRKVNAKVLGISEKFPLPSFAAEPFEDWLAKHTPLEGAGKAGTVAIFASCLGDYNVPKIAAATVRVLEKNGYSVVRPNQECCGMPNLDGGDVDAARAKAKANVAALLPLVEQGFPVIVPNPTCTYTIKKEWPELLGSPEAKKVAAHTFEAMEFVERLRREKTLDRDFKKGFGKIAYHAACHLRAQKIGTPGARILGLLPDTEVEIVEKCSAVDGTWGMKEQHYEMGRRYAQKLKRGIENVEPKLVVTDCPLSALRIEQENDIVPLHPMEALASAYGLSLDKESPA